MSTSHNHRPTLSKIEDSKKKSRYSKESTKKGQKERLAFLKEKGIETNIVSGKTTIDDSFSFQGNVENYVGMAQVPIGLAGPLLIKQPGGSGEFYIPLATTEGALVASYSRGMKACYLSGGITSVCLAEGVQRSPYFKFDTVITALSFSKWINSKAFTFQKITKDTSQYAELVKVKTKIEGNKKVAEGRF